MVAWAATCPVMPAALYWLSPSDAPATEVTTTMTISDA